LPHHGRRNRELRHYDVVAIATKSDVRIDKDVYNGLGARNVVKRYQSAGAAGGKPFEDQLAAWKKRLDL
jgi:hypothetical protein